MNIQYIISKRELLDFNFRNYTRTVKFFMKSLAIYTLILLPYISILINKINNKTLIVIYPIISILLLIIFKKKLILFTMTKDLEWKYSLKRYAYLFEKHHLIIDDKGISIKTKFGIKTLLYKSLTDICLIDDYIYIKINYMHYFLIPLSSFKDVSEQNLFLKYLLNNSKLKIKEKNQIII